MHKNLFIPKKQVHLDLQFIYIFAINAKENAKRQTSPEKDSASFGHSDKLSDPRRYISHIETSVKSFSGNWRLSR